MTGGVGGVLGLNHSHFALISVLVTIFVICDSDFFLFIYILDKKFLCLIPNIIVSLCLF